MPYDIRKRGSKYCVIKRDDGKTMGCHSSWAGADRQRRAIHANEASAEGSTVMSQMSIQETVPEGFGRSNPELASEETDREPWSGVLATIMSPTSDGRIVEADVDYRDLPVPFSVQPQKADGHDGAYCCGRIEELEFIPIEEFDQTRAVNFDMDEVREGSLVIWGRGSLDGSEHAEEAKRLLDNGAGVSLDGLRFTGKLWDKENLSEIDTSEMEMDELFEGLMSGAFLQGMSGQIAGVTVVDVPAFVEAKVMVAAAFSPSLHFGEKVVLTASAAGLAPLEPPTEWFYMPEPDEPTPLTIDDDGRVYGHLALWNQCHAAFASCERPPSSMTDYSFFHVGQLKTAEGDTVNVGRITVGSAGNAKGGHASLVLGRKGAMEHYDKTGCVAAFVRAKDGNHGIWLSGAVRSDAPAERIRDLRANPPSGDWRDYELVGVLSVPVAGFPIPRMAEARMVASANGEEEIEALVATAYTEPVFDEEHVITDGDEVVGQVVMGWTFPHEDENERVDIPTYRRRMNELSERRKALSNT